MAFSDEIQALKVRGDALRADMDTTLAALATALFNRLRPLPALDWMTDDTLRQASQAFAGSAIRSLVSGPQLP